jgi:polysaccharide pyruvyl transferase WcaK-like protein
VQLHYIARPKEYEVRIGLYGLFGIGNTGNDATLEAMIRNLATRLPDALLICVAHEPTVVEDTFDIPAVYISMDANQPGSSSRRREGIVFDAARRMLTEPIRWFRTWRFLNTIDHLVMPGTGLLDDFGVHPLQHPYQLWKWCLLARLTGTPVHFVAIGAGPIGNDLSRRFFTWAARLASSRSFRDAESRDFVAGLGLDTGRDEVVPDMVFSLPLHTDRIRTASDGPVRTVGIGVIEYHSWRNREDRNEDIYGPYLDKLGSFVIGLLDRGIDIRILTGQDTDWRAVEDLRTILAEHRPAELHRVVAHPVDTIHDLFAEISETDAVVATRFHSVLCSLILGRPVVSVGYATKNDVLMADFGLGHFCQHVWDFEPLELDRQLSESTSDIPSVRHAMLSKAAEHATTLAHHYDLLIERLTSS